ncbi:hypothetical protein HDU92_007537 [Lobulomyces angularis]|nr:hypothetical protein HDU92_007537 [Lobulomyces angularis]
MNSNSSFYSNPSLGQFSSQQIWAPWKAVAITLAIFLGIVIVVCVSAYLYLFKYFDEDEDREDEESRHFVEFPSLPPHARLSKLEISKFRTSVFNKKRPIKYKPPRKEKMRSMRKNKSVSFTLELNSLPNLNLNFNENKISSPIRLNFSENKITSPSQYNENKVSPGHLNSNENKMVNSLQLDSTLNNQFFNFSFNIPCFPEKFHEIKFDEASKKSRFSHRFSSSDYNSRRSSLVSSTDACIICLEDFEDGAEVRHLPCGHFYHSMW